MMRNALTLAAWRVLVAAAIATPLLTGVAAHGVSTVAAPSTQPGGPSTQPAASAAPQTNMSGSAAVSPAAAAPATQPADLRVSVLVLPFTPSGPADPPAIGLAVQQSLTADLSRPSNGRELQATSSATGAADTAAAIAAGKAAGAHYVVLGSYQTIDPTIKISGQVIDVSSGQVVGGLRAVGGTRDLFDLQDTIAFQTRYALGQQQLASRPQVTPSTQPVAIVPQGPLMATGSRYDNSDLARAVNSGGSLIESQDAAGQSYRRTYYDDNAGLYSGYGGYGYGFGYPFFFGGYGYGFGGGFYGGGYGYGGGAGGHHGHHDPIGREPGQWYANPPVKGFDQPRGRATGGGGVNGGTIGASNGTVNTLSPNFPRNGTVDIANLQLGPGGIPNNQGLRTGGGTMFRVGGTPAAGNVSVIGGGVRGNAAGR